MWNTLKKSCVWVSLLTVVAGGLTAPPVVVAQDEAKRKVVKRVEPVYPEMARQVRLSGTVRLLLVVTPEGKVEKMVVTGGHPLLAVAATNAAKQWAFEASKKETSETASIQFDYTRVR